MVIIHCWWERVLEGSVGHASLSLSDGTYISLWPENYQKVSSGSSKGPKLEVALKDDIKNEGRDPDKQVEILKCLNLVDESKVKKWWMEYKTKVKYNVLASNCAQTVYEALMQGTKREVRYAECYKVLLFLKILCD
jgi:hypothetical protein